MEGQVNYEYLKRWLDSRWLKKVREGNNELGVKLSRTQVWNIMKGRSKNFEFRNILVRQAILNEELSTKSNSK